MDPVSPIKMWRPDLPHWEQSGKIQFITFRLNDSLPVSLLKNLKIRKENFLYLHPKPWNAETLREYNRLFSCGVDELLHAGHGSCILTHSEIRKIVADALKHFNGNEYYLGAYVIMPNHIHLLACPIGNHSILKTIEKVKRYSARAINKIKGIKGELWSRSYDRLIRNSEHLCNSVGYIYSNPEGLPPDTYELGGELLDKSAL